MNCKARSLPSLSRHVACECWGIRDSVGWRCHPACVTMRRVNTQRDFWPWSSHVGRCFTRFCFLLTLTMCVLFPSQSVVWDVNKHHYVSQQFLISMLLGKSCLLCSVAKQLLLQRGKKRLAHILHSVTVDKRILISCGSQCDLWALVLQQACVRGTPLWSGAQQDWLINTLDLAVWLSLSCYQKDRTAERVILITQESSSLWFSQITSGHLTFHSIIP